MIFTENKEKENTKLTNKAEGCLYDAGWLALQGCCPAYLNYSISHLSSQVGNCFL